MNNDMLSVPRELLKTILSSMQGQEEYLKGEDELQALLAQPNICTKDGGQCGLGGYCEPCHNVEPVAVMYDDGDVILPNDCVSMEAFKTICRVNTPLYRHPHAQAPVVLPARYDESQYRGTSLLAVRRWNACLDELKRLNPTL